jgi:hypothetical protein
MDSINQYYSLAKKLSLKFSDLTNVIAVALGGSSSMRNYDPQSDIDLYVVINSEIPLEVRQAITQNRPVSCINLDLHFWDNGDAWLDNETGLEVDIIYWDSRWVENEINQLLIHNKARLGYSTCIWHTIKNSSVLHDTNGWLTELKEFCNQPYPENLRRAIIQLNYPVLRNVIPAYLYQIKKAVIRGDPVSINHRVAALLASYFDIIFAVNGVTHPGEKRLLTLTSELCTRTPKNMKQQVEEVLKTAATSSPVLIDKINLLIDGLDDFLFEAGYSEVLKLYST